MKQTLEIKELPPALNGSNGLQRTHWGKLNKTKKNWVWLIKSTNPQKHKGKVKINYTRISTHPMDLDNVASSFKFVGDALEKNGVIENDSPKILENLSVQWEKATKKSEQGIRVEIEDAN